MPIMPTLTHALNNGYHMPACARARFNRHHFSMSQNHKEEKLILFNYEFHTCIIDELFFFPAFSVIAKLRRGEKKGSCWVSEVCPFFVPFKIMLGKVPDVGTFLWQDLLKPLSTDCKWLPVQPLQYRSLCYCVWSSRAPDMLRSRRVHAGVSERCGGMSLNVEEPTKHRDWHGFGWQVKHWAVSAASNVASRHIFCKYIIVNILYQTGDIKHQVIRLKSFICKETHQYSYSK